MRWERLFTELEAGLADLEAEERDSFAADLRDGDWAGTSWRELLGGSVVLDVRGVGRVEGEALMVNDQLVQLGSPSVDHVVNVRAVLSVLSSQRRADERSLV